MNADDSADSESEEEEPPVVVSEKSKKTERVVKEKERKAGQEISALVNYVEAVRFLTFEQSERKFFYF